MILVIAEKKELANAIADAVDGVSAKDGYAIKKGDYVITYLGGHAMELVDPEEIDEKYAKWSAEDLPIYFYPWPQKVKSEKETMVNQIGAYLEDCDYVIHAGDNDDEGQLLVDEVLQHFGYTGKVMRLDTGNTTREGLKKAFARMTDNAGHISAGRAAYARAIADKAFGYSLSRHFTIVNHVKLNVGRVQTPTLGLVVSRDLQIEGHEKTYFYNLLGDFLLDGRTIRAKFTPAEDDPMLTDGKCLDSKALEAVRDKLLCKNLSASILKKELKEAPPLPFNLVKLQSYCDKKWGYTPAEVMEITQHLRDEYKAITYNRSDCQYLTDEHFAEAPETIAKTLQNLGKEAETYQLDAERRSKAFHAKYVKLHFAIIPTGEPVDLAKLTEKEQNVYLAIANRYLMQFAPETQKEKTDLRIESSFGPFLAAETLITAPGWRKLDDAQEDEKDAEDEAEAKGLSELATGTYRAVSSSMEVKQSETKPPKRYTPASLNEDLTRIVKYVSDPKIKELLLKKDDGKKGENGSIGTTATRAMIIDNLVKRGYLTMSDKHIISTAKGRVFYNALPDEIKKADTTAVWYAHQEAIIDGREEANNLTESVLKTINHVIATCKEPTIQIAKKEAEIVGKCPLCGNDVVHVSNAKLKAYCCSNRDCKFILWESAYGSKISAENAKKLLAGQSTNVIAFKSKKTGKAFKGKLKLKPDQTLEMEFVQSKTAPKKK